MAEHLGVRYLAQQYLVSALKVSWLLSSYQLESGKATEMPAQRRRDKFGNY